MVYDPGTIDASLSAAVGCDAALIAQLRSEFVASVERNADLMKRARCDANWVIAASRLQSIAASFAASELMAIAGEALSGAPGDPVVLRKLRKSMDDLARP